MITSQGFCAITIRPFKTEIPSLEGQSPDMYQHRTKWNEILC